MEAFGPSGFEREVNGIAKAYMEPFSDEVVVDKLGTVTFVAKGGSERPRVLLAGHTDEIGFIVSTVTKEGYLTFNPLGGWWDQVLLGQSDSAEVGHRLVVFRVIRQRRLEDRSGARIILLFEQSFCFFQVIASGGWNRRRCDD